MSINLYVGNLSYSMNDDQLRDTFAQFGEVTSAKIVMDRETGRSRGFGFVEMADQEAGKTAMEKLNGEVVCERKISIKEALPRDQRPRRERPQGGYRNDRGGNWNN